MTDRDPLTTFDDTASGAAVLARHTRAVMGSYGTPRAVFVRGQGVHVFDAEGRRHLDLLSGIAVNALGHAHPSVTAAISAQLGTLGQVSNFFATPAQVRLAEVLGDLVTANEPGLDARVYFANSGAEANEAAFKITRLTGRTRIVAMEDGFHGRTMGALALTAKAAYREPFAPLPGEVTWVPFGDAEALAAAVDETTAAVVLEPVQGEAGVIVPPEGYLARVREITAAAGALMWVDEVQTGIGRTGEMFASVAQGVTPDLLTVAKALGNGYPIGACIGTGRAATLLGPGSHGSTYGGNPVAAVAGLAVLSVIERDDVLASVRRVGAHLTAAIDALDTPLITGVRGPGLMIAVQLAREVGPRLVELAQADGFVINAPRPDVLRLVPPLIITAEQCDEFVAGLARWCARILEETP